MTNSKSRSKFGRAKLVDAKPKKYISYCESRNYSITSYRKEKAKKQPLPVRELVVDHVDEEDSDSHVQEELPSSDDEV